MIDSVTKSQSVGKNAVWNLAAYIFSVTVTFFVSPFTIRTLGDSRYGAWALMADLVGYYGLLDMGIRGAVSYYVANYDARKESDNLRSSIASSFWLLSSIGSIVLTLGSIAAIFFSHLIIQDQVNQTEVTIALLLMTGSLALSFPMEVFTSVLVGHQRFDIVNAVEVATRLPLALSIVVVLTLGGGLVGLSLMQVIFKILSWTILYRYAQRVSGGISISPKWFSRDAVRQLTSFGGKSFVLNLTGIIIARTDLLIVGTMLGLKWVTFYNIGRMLVQYISSANFSITRVFAPKLTSLYATGKHDEMRGLFLNGLRVSALLSVAATASTLVFAKYFIGLWLGPQYISGAWTERSDIVMTILLIAAFPRFLQSMSWQMIFASGKVSYLMWQKVLEAAANVGLTLVLVKYYGLAGVAMGTLFPALISQALISMYVFRTFEIRPSEYFSKGIGRPLFAGVLQASLAWVVVSLHEPWTWVSFAAEVVICGIIAVVICAFVGLTSEERTSYSNKVISMFVFLTGRKAAPAAVK
jgi:O-antigen/teichoic acid export membrane protein